LKADGVVVLDKPAGISSARALREIKQRYEGKIGHAGTLDPFATGVLLVLVGDATRLSGLAMALPKEYRARVRFGWRTDTLDSDGEVVATCDPGPERELPLDRFRGEIEQMPPAFSALKVRGTRAYELARKGETPELAPRTVRVDRCEVEETAWPEVTLRIRCGAGTYIRALARDLGEAIGLPASLVALRRTAIGPFLADDAGTLHPPRDLVRAAGVPECPVDGEDALRFVTGRSVPCSLRGRAAAVAEGRVLGLGEADGSRLFPSSVLAHARAEVEQGQI
jgi:tRNA pseudouridine55 synthase